MQRLELEPQTYDIKFSELTGGINDKVQEWVLSKVRSTDLILELGCGTGKLAKKIALKGKEIIAVDKNPKMINHALENYSPDSHSNLTYKIGSYQEKDIIPQPKDLIVSTFMISELRPFEQQEFLKYAWNHLKKDGRLLIADEFIPTGFWKLIFSLKRWYYKKKLRRLQLKGTQVLKWFFNYLEPLGFEIIDQKKWKHGSIQGLELRKKGNENGNYDKYYLPKLKSYKGLKSQLRIYRCLLTGQIDKVAIEPGVYKSGNPGVDSPIVVTSNYDYTYIKVMRDLKGIDAWVLCVDSNGINVWCAARGNDFGNYQLMEAVKTSGIQHLTSTKTLILPQLAAGGISSPKLPQNSKEFPFKVKYGPVWSKYLPEYIREHPKKKSPTMKIAHFSLAHRFRAGITHLTFSFRKIFIFPLLVITLVFLGMQWINGLLWVGEIALSIILINAIISIFFPITNFTRCFIIKGTCFGVINVAVMSIITWYIQYSIIYIVLNILIFFWLGFFTTMSFSGYTMTTNPREIQEQYSLFSIINIVILILGIISSISSIILLQI